MPRPRISLVDYCPPGTAFAFRVKDGRYGACRVLRIIHSPGEKSPRALVALSEFLDSHPPPLNHPALRKILCLNHHSWSNQPEMIWVSEPPPASFEKLGSMPVLKKDSSANSFSFAAWSSLPFHRYTQWRWDHDRAALLAEETLENDAEERKQAQSAAGRKKTLAAVTLSSIQQRPTLFPRWKKYPSPKARRAIEQTIQSFIAATARIKKPTRRDVTRELRRCADALNNLDAGHGHPIETVEREDIFELFEEILTAAGHPRLLEKLDEWRAW